MADDRHPGDRPRLDFLHGVRGLAALTVVGFHCFLHTQQHVSRWPVEVVKSIIAHGYLAVAVFLVLSGFLLGTPVVKDGLVLRGGARGFMHRRSLRILPPYYAAYGLHLLFFAAANWVLPQFGFTTWGEIREQMRMGYRWPSVAAHVLLVHNLDSEWVRGMDAILWTIACEWQIYLLFALVLVPLWRGGGLWAPLVLCGLLGAGITEAWIRGWCTYFVPWMIPVFATGMAAAAVAFGDGRRATAMRRWPWGAITAAMLAVSCGAIAMLDATVTSEQMRGGIPAPYYHLSLRIRWIPDVLAGMTAAAFIIWLCHGHPATPDATASQGPVARRVCGFLESRWLLALGLFSYSLYLTHGMVLILISRITSRLWFSYPLHFLAVMVGGTLASLVVGYAFHLCFERRFMTRETRGMFEASPARTRTRS